MKTKTFSVCWIFCAALAAAAPAATPPKARTVMNVVNFVRGCEPRNPKMDLVKPIAEEIALNTKHHLPNTILLQYDAMIRPDLMKVVKSAEPDKTEYGVWIEMARPLVEKAGIPWRGRKGWDWDWFINPGFLMAYTHEERAKLVDEIFRLFRAEFGDWPKSVGSWLLDAWSMEYMQKKYDVKGFCICREQDNTDAYGLRGGYFNGLYYPSRKNMLSAAVDMANAVKAPVFKMLTPDPIYNYAKSATPKGVDSCPCTLEPVWHSGFTPSVVDWYFRVYTGPGMLNLSYMQTGQENSFGWEAIGKGLPYQIEVVARLAREGKIEVEKMCDTAERFMREHHENCPQTQVALEDWAGDNKSVWYNSKHYRANLFLAGDALRFRDVHKMCDGFEEPFLDKVCTGWQALYFTPPVVDEYLFKTEGRFKPVEIPGRFAGLAVETPDAETLVVTAKGKDVPDVRVTFTPGKISVAGCPEAALSGLPNGVHALAFAGCEYRVGVARENDAVVVDLSLPEEPGRQEPLEAKIAAACKVVGCDTWHGRWRVKFEFRGRAAWIVEPSVRPEKGRPWTWTMQWADAYVERTGVPAMLSRGWHHVTIDLFDTRMDDNGVEIAAAFQKFLVETLGFDAKACLVGPSWGGFFSTRYAGLHPENVAKIYLDAPLLTFDGFRTHEGKETRLSRIGSWAALEPKNGKWTPIPAMPVNFAETIAKAGIPVLLVYGGQDQTVDPRSNCEAFAARFEKAGGKLKTVVRWLYGHHPHGLEHGDNTIVSFLTGTDANARKKDR